MYRLRFYVGMNLKDMLYINCRSDVSKKSPSGPAMEHVKAYLLDTEDSGGSLSVYYYINI